MELSYNQIHEKSLLLMYEFLIYQDLNMTIDFKSCLEDYFCVPYDEIPQRLKLILIKALKNQNEATIIISKYLRDWKFKRLNYCIQALLILSVSNYMSFKNLDKAVIINVAIKLARKYGEETSYRFVNGILDNCLNDNIRK